MWDGTFQFEKKLVMLTEGAADKAFFEKLVDAQNLEKFDFPWPVAGDDDFSAFPDAEKLFGRDAYGKMLSILDSHFTLQPELCDQIIGILIVTDARDDPDDSFKHVCKQIPAGGNFGVPSSPMKIAAGQNGRPSLAVMVLPIDGEGSLETVCIEEFRAKSPEVYSAMETYVATDPIEVLKWSAEKRDKARLHCMIAATNEADPTRSLQYAFSSSKGPPIIDVSADCFHDLCESIRSFCDGVTAA